MLFLTLIVPILLLFILLLFFLLAPVVLVPMAPPATAQLYQQGVSLHLEHVASETTPSHPLPSIDWREVLAVETVLREQRFADVTLSDAITAAQRFTARRSRVEEHCASPDLSSTGDAATDESLELQCETVEIVWYEPISFDAVMSQLRFRPDQIDWARALLRTITDPEVSPWI